MSEIIQECSKQSSLLDDHKSIFPYFWGRDFQIDTFPSRKLYFSLNLKEFHYDVIVLCTMIIKSICYSKANIIVLSISIF